MSEPAGPTTSRGFGTRLASDSLVYGIGGVANQAVAVLLVPIYARELGPSGVGVTGVLNATISLALMLVGLALPQAFFRWYLREAETRADRDRVLRTVLGIRLAASLAGAALVLLAVIPLTAVLYEGAHLLVFLLVAPIVAFDSFTAIPLSFLRAERRPRGYVTISVARAVTGTVLILGLVLMAGIGVLGVALGAAIAAGLSAVVGAWTLLRAGVVRPRLDRSLARPMLGFALPLVPAGIAGWTLNLSDRPLLQAIGGDTGVVGIYTLGYTAGLVINALVVQPFALAWGAAHWEVSRADDAPRTFARVLTWFLALAAGVALLLSALGTDAIRVLAGPDFEASRYVVPFSAFAYVLYGAHAIVASGLSITGRSGLVAGAMGIAASASVLLNLALIPFLGMYGAAISTLVGYLLLAAVSGTLGQRQYPVPWQLGRAALVLAVAGGLAVAALLGPDHVLWRLACVAAYAPILLGLRVIHPAGARTLIAVLRRR
ncbi:MAG TPA: oligosaccharide flippase family protein [Candidatus Angelobacter sp.]|nr:oligosaccharide flippase family protein [Candidatus Angelobacter sp.]